MLVSYTSLFQTFIFIGLTLALVIQRFWPRNEDGSLMDPDEVTKKLPDTGMRISPSTLFLLLLILTLAVMLN